MWLVYLPRVYVPFNQLKWGTFPSKNCIPKLEMAIFVMRNREPNETISKLIQWSGTFTGVWSAHNNHTLYTYAYGWNMNISHDVVAIQMCIFQMWITCLKVTKSIVLTIRGCLRERSQRPPRSFKMYKYMYLLNIPPVLCKPCEKWSEI